MCNGSNFCLSFVAFSCTKPVEFSGTMEKKTISSFQVISGKVRGKFFDPAGRASQHTMAVDRAFDYSKWDHIDVSIGRG